MRPDYRTCTHVVTRPLESGGFECKQCGAVFADREAFTNGR